MRPPSVPVAADGHKKTVSSPQRPHTVHSFIRFLRIKFALSAYFPLEIALSMPYNGFTWSCSTSCDRWKRHKAMRYGRDSRLQVPCVGAGNTAQGFSIPYYSPFSQNTQGKTYSNPLLIFQIPVIAAISAVFKAIPRGQGRKHPPAPLVLPLLAADRGRCPSAEALPAGRGRCWRSCRGTPGPLPLSLGGLCAFCRYLLHFPPRHFITHRAHKRTIPI